LGIGRKYMNKILKMSKKKISVIYIIFDMLFVGMGMGVPFFCILFGFPVGWYIAKKSALHENNLSTILNGILKYALYTSLFTLLLMLGIWVPLITILLDPGGDFVNTGIPMILYDPKMSFIGWMILMIFISPFLQLLTTVFASNVTLWRLFKKDDRVFIDKK
jgi:hypothetical protein